MHVIICLLYGFTVWFSLLAYAAITDGDWLESNQQIFSSAAAPFQWTSVPMRDGHPIFLPKHSRRMKRG